MIPRVKQFIEANWAHNINKYLTEEFKIGDTSIIKKLEKRVCTYTGSKYAVAVNSATNAIMMILKSFNLQQGQEVILPNYGHPAALNCVRLLGLQPILVDIKEETLSMDPELLEDDITNRTKAVIQIQNNGALPNDLYIINEICSSKNIPLIEDASPSFGQRFNSVHAGTFGEFGVFSFSETKSLFAGEGAVIITKDKFHYERLKEIRHAKNYADPLPAGNFNLSVLLAAFLLPQFDNLKYILSERERVFNLYVEKGLRAFSCKGVTTFYPTIMYLSKQAAEIQKRLAGFKIETRHKYYPLFNRIVYDTESYDVSERIWEQLIDLPFYVGMNESDVHAICNIIKLVELGND